MLSSAEMDNYGELWAEDAVLEFPYAPAGNPAKLVGKTTIISYFKDALKQLTGLRFFEVQFFPSLEPDVLFIEFQGEAKISSSGRRYDQTYIGRLHMKNGKIASYREFYNPKVLLEASSNTDRLSETFNIVDG